MSCKKEARLLTLGDERQGSECNNGEFGEHLFAYILRIKTNVCLLKEWSRAARSLLADERWVRKVKDSWVATVDADPDIWCREMPIGQGGCRVTWQHGSAPQIIPSSSSSAALRRAQGARLRRRRTRRWSKRRIGKWNFWTSSKQCVRWSNSNFGPAPPCLPNLNVHFHGPTGIFTPCLAEPIYVKDVLLYIASLLQKIDSSGNLLDLLRIWWHIQGTFTSDASDFVMQSCTLRDPWHFAVILHIYTFRSVKSRSFRGYSGRRLVSEWHAESRRQQLSLFSYFHRRCAVVFCYPLYSGRAEISSQIGV